jgi:tripartite-type tricarboxylate transporter receptor subunit TctC
MIKLLLALLVAGAALFSLPLCADDYPSKPITLVNVFGPGSTSDTICRVIAEPLSVALNEAVIVEDRTGASGALAAFYVARAAPDGYTLMMATKPA